MSLGRLRLLFIGIASLSILHIFSLGQTAQAECWDGQCSGVWSQTGNALTISTTESPSLTALDDTSIAFINNDNHTLRTYSWDGTDWSQVGNSFSLGTMEFNEIEALDASTIVAGEWTNAGNLRTYSWDGTNWSQTGNTFSLSAGGNQADFISLARMDSSTIAYWDNEDDFLRTYSWDGTDWSQAGNSLFVTHSCDMAIEAKDSTTVVLYCNATDIKTYSWDGTDWSEIDTVSVTGASGDMTLVTDNTMLFADLPSDKLSTYIWNGNSWDVRPLSTDVAGLLLDSMDTLDHNTIVLYNYEIGVDEIQVYESSSCPASGGAGGGGSLGSCSNAGTWQWNADNSTLVFCNGSEFISMSSTGNYGSCPSGLTGALEYDSSVSDYKFCDGTNWIAVADAGADGTCSFTTPKIDFDSASNQLEWCNGSNWIGMGASPVESGTICTGSWTEIGTPAAHGANSNLAKGHIQIDTNLMAFYDDIDDNLYAFEWAGATLSQVGTSFATGGGEHMAKVGQNTVAVASCFNSTLKTYSWSGSAWSQSGNTYTLSCTGATGPDGMTNVADNKIVMADSDDLKVFSWDGSDWSPQGNALTTLNFPSSGAFLTKLDDNLIAVNDADGSGELRTYSWDGSDWSQVGNGFAHSGTIDFMGELDSNAILAVDSAADELSTYDWDGTNWAENTDSIASVGANDRSPQGMNGDTAILLDVGTDEFVYYRLTGCDTNQCVFITSTSGKGNWKSSIEAYDAECQARAEAVGHTGVYKAWLSYNGGSTPASNFVQGQDVYVLPSGTMVAESWTNLTGGSLAAGINEEEDGSTTSASYVWTGTTSTGGYDSLAGNCSDWSSGGGGAGPGGGAGAGDVGSATSTWTAGTDHKCGSTLPIMCFEQ